MKPIQINKIQCKICNMVTAEGNNILTTGDRAKVTFRFCNRPEYLQIGNQLIFSDGKIKAVGEIIE